MHDAKPKHEKISVLQGLGLNALLLGPMVKDNQCYANVLIILLVSLSVQ